MIFSSKRQSMVAHFVAAMACGCSLLLAGCKEPEPPQPPKARVAVEFATPDSKANRGLGNISRVVIDLVEGNDFRQTAIDPFKWGQPTNLHYNLTVGKKYTIKVNAYNAASQVELTGSVEVQPPNTNSVGVTVLLQPPAASVNIAATIHEFNGPPSIEFTSVPPIGSGAALTGKIRNILPRQAKVQVFIRVASQWWVKPTFAQPYTLVGDNFAWATNIVTGGNDASATEVLAYLIK